MASAPPTTFTERPASTSEQRISANSPFHGARFIDVQFVHSGPVRLYHRRQADIARYLLNYSGRDRRYTEKVRNCQAFAADFYAFAAGKKGIEVYSSFLRPFYQQRTHLFLYDPALYQNPLERVRNEL